MSLRSLSDHQIIARTHELVRRERRVTLAVLLHLNEIERRGLYLELGHPSMFEYCTNRLGYSRSAADRRLQTARCLAKFPQVQSLLESNDVTLSTMAQVSRVITKENCDDILARMRGRSQREVEAIVAEYAPAGACRDRIRTVVVRVPAAVAPPVPAPTPETVPAGTPSPTSPSAAGAGPAPETQTARSRETAPAPVALESRVYIQFLAGKDFMFRLQRVRSLLSHRLPGNASLEQVFAMLIEHVLEQEDPARRNQRRQERKVARQERTAGTSAPSTGGGTRFVPASVRDLVYERDHGRCSFVGRDGHRCGATHYVQLDHIRPVARGGTSTPDNLRLLCAYHNRHEARRLMGPRAAPPQPRL